MNSVVGVHEYLHEGLLVCLVDLTDIILLYYYILCLVDLAEPLAHQTEELLICSLLGTTVDDHVTKLQLLTYKHLFNRNKGSLLIDF